MSRCFAILLAFAACAASAQGRHAAMVVSATVVDTCHFGAQARCRTPATRLLVEAESVAPDAASGLRRRIVHL